MPSIRVSAYCYVPLMLYKDSDGATVARVRDARLIYAIKRHKSAKRQGQVRFKAPALARHVCSTHLRAVVFRTLAQVPTLRDFEGCAQSYHAGSATRPS